VLSEELIATGHREGEAEVVSGRDDSPGGGEAEVGERNQTVAQRRRE
jgi:hypothetical protein